MINEPSAFAFIDKLPLPMIESKKMNANELADRLDLINEQQNLQIQAATMLRQLQAEIDKVNAEWVQAAMALGKAVQEIHGQKAEIEAGKQFIYMAQKESDKLYREIEELKAQLLKFNPSFKWRIK